MSRSRLHVLGNAGIDIVLRVSHAPADGETLIAHDARRAPGGKGLNQAVVAARAGALVRFSAVLGIDPDATPVREALAQEGFSDLILKTASMPTDMSVVIVDDAGGNRIVSTSCCADTITPDDAGAFAAALQPGDVLLMQGNLSVAATRAAAREAAERGGTVVLNLAPFRRAAADALPRCHLIVNQVEAMQASGLADPDAAALALCDAGALRTIVTLGNQGCLVAERGTIQSFAAVVADAIDTTGAGDTFCGVLAAGMARGDGLATLIGAAQMAAAITVSRHGAFDALPSAAELADLMASQAAHPQGREKYRP